MKNTNRKTKTAALSIFSNTILIVLKVLAGTQSGSVSIISEAIHSGMDLVAAIIAFYSVRISSKPADRNHPYGHGKIENVSGVIEGFLIFAAALMIIIEAIKKIINPAEVEETTAAIIVMLFSAIVNTIVSRIIYKVAIEEDSVALEADALHLKTDVYTSIGVGLGLVLIKLVKVSILDPIVAILVACLIIKEAWELSSNAFYPILDWKLSDSEEEKIMEIVSKYSSEVFDIHDLKTRKAGHIRYIEFHVKVDNSLTVMESHNLNERIEKDLKSAFKDVNLNIRMEPKL